MQRYAGGEAKIRILIVLLRNFAVLSQCCFRWKLRHQVTFYLDVTLRVTLIIDSPFYFRDKSCRKKFRSIFENDVDE